MCKIATAQIGYKPVENQQAIDITVKTGTGLGRVFAPTWELVSLSKKKQIPWKDYITGYTGLMRHQYVINQKAFLELLSIPEPVICCYCNDTSRTTKHCHRYVLIDILQKIATKHDLPFEYIGECSNADKT